MPILKTTHCSSSSFFVSANSDPAREKAIKVAELKASDGSREVLYSRDGRQLVVISSSGEINVWWTPVQEKASDEKELLSSSDESENNGGYVLANCLNLQEQADFVHTASISFNSRLLLVEVFENDVLVVFDLFELKLKSRWIGSYDCAYFESDTVIVVTEPNGNVKRIKIAD